MILKNGRVFDGEKFIEESAVIIEGDRISRVLREKELSEELERGLLKGQEIIDLKGMVLAPGFIDLQINGCGGVLFNDEITKKTLEIMNETNKRYGCTSFLPTLITSPDGKILKALKLIDELKETKEEIGVLGLHIEGPYISVEKKGVHRPDYIRVFGDEIVEEIAKIGYDGVKIMTIAPENAEIKHLQILKDSKINIAMGHTNATYAQVEEKEEYFTHATHFFNAMRGFDSREPGVIGYLLDKKNIKCGIIVDGLHASYPSVRVAKEVMKENMYLVTDAVSPMGTDMKEFIFEGHLVRHENGKCWDPKTGSLGGSALDMITGVKNLICEVGVGEEEALRMATSYPAKAVQVENRYGYIREGYIADLTYYDKEYRIKGTVAKGNLTRY